MRPLTVRSPFVAVVGFAVAGLLVAGCGATLVPRGGTAGSPAGVGGVRAGAGPVAAGRDSGFFRRGRDQSAGTPYDAEARRVCRTASWPRGWVAVAYERGGGACPGREAVDSAGVAAVLVRLAGRPVGAGLDVCADQGIPPGWSEVRDEAPGDPEACPGAERDGRPGVRRIRRGR